jgi:hypothetical protein
MSIWWDAIAYGALAGVSIAALRGWWLAAERAAIARDEAAYEQWSHAITRKTLGNTIDAKIDAEDRLRRIERQRHESAKHARAAQIARQRALRDATTARLKEGA